MSGEYTKNLDVVYQFGLPEMRPFSENPRLWGAMLRDEEQERAMGLLQGLGKVDPTAFEFWEVKFLRYLKVRHGRQLAFTLAQLTSLLDLHSRHIVADKDMYQAVEMANDLRKEYDSLLAKEQRFLEGLTMPEGEGMPWEPSQVDVVWKIWERVFQSPAGMDGSDDED